MLFSSSWPVNCYSGMSAVRCSKSSRDIDKNTAALTLLHRHQQLWPQRVPYVWERRQKPQSHVIHTRATSALIAQRRFYQLRCASSISRIEQKTLQLSIQTLMQIRVVHLNYRAVSIRFSKRIVKMQIKTCFWKHTIWAVFKDVGVMVTSIPWLWTTAWILID